MSPEGGADAAPAPAGESSDDDASEALREDNPLGMLEPTTDDGALSSSLPSLSFDAATPSILKEPHRQHAHTQDTQHI